jgi:putative drug exporter of the RND superfamily
MAPEGAPDDSPPMHSNTFAARAGRWSAKNRKKAIWGWLAFVAIAIVIGNVVGMKSTSDDSGTGQSGRADKIIDDHFPKEADENVLVQAPRGGHATDPAVRKAVAATMAAVGHKRGVYDVQSPYAKGNDGQISKDGRSVLVQFKIKGDDDATKQLIDPIVAAVDRVKDTSSGVFVGQFGDASANKAIDQAFSDDFQKAEMLSLPITLLILIVAFGALVAAGVPLLLGLSAVMATLGLVAIPSQFIPMDDTVSSVVLLIGLAVGVDYTLFYLRREREEKRRGAGKLEAVHTAAATSGRAVLVSGVTVIVAMAGMFFAGDNTFTAIAVGTIMVVAIAMIGSVTVVPALLAWLGDRIDKGRIPLLHRRMNRGSESGLWSWVLGKALRRPVLAALASGGLLIVLALPVFGMHTVLTGTDDLPRKLEVMKTYDRMQAAFPGGQIPAVVMVQADDVTTPQIAAATKQLGQRAFATGKMNGPLDVTVSPDKRVATIDIPMKGDGTDKLSEEALSALRGGGIVQQTVGDAPGVQHAYVTGMAAGTHDFNSLMKSHAPIVFAFVLSLAFLLLLVTFRSIVIPITAIGLNLLSVGAAYGVLTWIFQDGHLEGLLDFKSNGGIVSWLPLFLFVVLFGLSMDYHVFILSRIREAFDRGMKTEDAVAHGIRATAGTVTSAAIVMVAVFAIFATLSTLDMKQLGIGLSVAILLDATIVRGVLLPATMKLLGKWNWYLPKRLEWLPKISHDPTPEPSRA